MEEMECMWGVRDQSIIEYEESWEGRIKST